MSKSTTTDEISVPEASDYLNVTQRTVINYIKTKEIEAIKVGKSWHIKKPSLHAFAQRYDFPRTKPTEKIEQEIDKPIKAPESKEENNKAKNTPSQHTVSNLRLFLIAKEILSLMTPESLPEDTSLQEKIYFLRLNALENLGGGYYSFDPRNKARLYRASRESIGGILALLHFASKAKSENNLLIEKIETELLPAYSSLIRRMEKKNEKS